MKIDSEINNGKSSETSNEISSEISEKSEMAAKGITEESSEHREPDTNSASKANLAPKAKKYPVSHAIANMAEVATFNDQELDRLKILHYGTNNKQLIKTFRDLRTKLANQTKTINYVCMISSVSVGGGASYISENLGAAIALDRSKTTLIIDCNLYSPTIDRLLITDPEAGITDYLYTDDIDIQDIVYASGIPRLRVIPVGNNIESGTEFFSSVRMSQFIKTVKERYPDRYILVIAPPAGEYAAEAHILASLCDFSVLVVPYGKVSEGQITASIDAIGKDNLAGMVFNN